MLFRSLKVGTLSMILHILCVLVQLAIQRRDFGLLKRGVGRSVVYVKG